jgi:hypothetical protein
MYDPDMRTLAAPGSYTANLTIFVLGLVAGTLVALGAELLRAWFRRPKLCILEDRPEEAEKFSCHAIVVTNTGRTTATHCSGMISLPQLNYSDMLGDSDILTLKEAGLSPEKFDVRGPETFLMKAGNFRNVINELVAWSRIGNPVEISLHPHTFAMLDVCRFMKGPKAQLHIPSEKGWKAVRLALKPGSYLLEVMVVAENARSKPKLFAMECGPTGLSIVPKS